MEGKNFWKNKKVLVVVLGIYGGGVATAKWLLRKGAKVSITDLRTEAELKHSLERFTEKEKQQIRFILGGQHEEDFVSADYIVAGPGVPDDSPFLLAARQAEVPIENEASIFFRHVSRPVIAATGTRGKTTVVSWIAALLSGTYPEVKICGNAQTGVPSGSNPLLAEIDRVKDQTPVIAELSSWQLEYLPNARIGPNVALITNVFPDHLNRYGGSMEKYALAKANIFLRQTPHDFLVLNGKNPWTKFFLSLKPSSQVFFFSAASLLKGQNGVFVRQETLWFREKDHEKKLADMKGFAKKWGKHNMENFAAAALAAYLFNRSIRFPQKVLQDLPTVPFRQEVVRGGFRTPPSLRLKDQTLTIINDSAATSPDAVSAALARFCRKRKSCVLITGGTDKDLDFSPLAKDMKKLIPSEHVIFLNGTATKKLLRALFTQNFFQEHDKLKVFETLEECVQAARELLASKSGTLLFSPGAASFEKFKNEFERGEQFNMLLRDFS